jgi:excinuclease ABC subunit C
MIDIDSLPEEPGCYLFLDEKGTILYIGKAKNLKKRVSSYFSGREQDAKTAKLVRAIDSVDFIVTGTEVEALILENTLIKRHQPKFNIDLKDSKNYAYIHLSDDPFPRIGIARKARGRGTFFGPFVSARERDYVLALVKKTFGLRSCRKLPKRACLRYHMGTCSAPCIGEISEEDYGELISRANEILKGRAPDLLVSLKREMAECANRQEFEKAIEVRGQIAAIEHLSRRQNVVRPKALDEDVINYIVQEDTVYLMLFHVDRGTLAEKQEYTFDAGEESIEEFLVQYYAEHTPPAEIILPDPPGEAIEGFLSERRGRKVRITVPQRGAKKNLLDLVEKNIEITFFGDRLKLEALKRGVGLPEIPRVIECFDISHLSGSAMVGSMVQFREGRPDKQHYRRFKIKTVEGIDDFAAIAEVVHRRYARLQAEDGDFPDLIIIDGGKGQLAAAQKSLEKLGLKIPIISIAKREEEIYVPGFSLPLPLSRKQKASLFIQEIRDEAHRFAIAYNRLLRKKEVIK